MVNHKLFKFLSSHLFMRRGWYIFFLVAVVVLLVSGTFVSAQDAEQTVSNVSSDAGLWGTIKDNMVRVFNAISTFADKYIVGPIIGTRTFGGKSIHIFSGNFWSERFFSYISLSVWIILWSVVFGFFQLRLGNAKSERNIVFKFTFGKWLKFTKFALIFAVLYPILMGIPFINRILQIVTLEVLGVAVVWRAFIVSAVFIFGPLYFKRYIAYRVEIREYKEELQKVAGEEIIKAMAKG